MFKKLPKIYLGFPVADAVSDDRESTPERPHERGIAMIIAVMVISLIMITSSDLILTSQVDSELAIKIRDSVKAEYLAKSRANLAIFTASADFGVTLYQFETMKTEPETALGGIWSLMAGIPLGGEDGEMVTAVASSMGLKSVMDSGVLDQLKQFDGSMNHSIDDESKRINLNMCFRSPSGCNIMKLLVRGLLSCPAEKSFLEKRKITAAVAASRIADWTSQSKGADGDSQLSDKNEPYQRKEHPYNTKNAPLDTLEELRAVDGWDDDMLTVFGPYFTTYPFVNVVAGTSERDRPRINLNTIPREMLACLMSDGNKDIQAKIILALKARDTDQGSITSGKSIGDILRELAGYSSGSANQTDTNNKANWFSKFSNTFRINAVGKVGDQGKRLTEVIERVMPDGKDVKSSYRVLYAHMANVSADDASAP